MSTAEPKSSRRRGSDLLENLYEAVLKLVAEANPLTLTFHQIAQAANTSRTVLYRRWPTVLDLLYAVYTHKARLLFEGTFLEQLPDTGSLRGDFIQLLRRYQQVMEEIGVAVLNNYYFLRLQDPDNQHKPAIHTQAVGKHLTAVRTLLQKAKARGEGVKQVADLTLMLPFDLLRAENLFRPGNMSSRRIEGLVDEVLLPVFSANRR